jgi:hypothetical protein
MTAGFNPEQRQTDRTDDEAGEEKGTEIPKRHRAVGDHAGKSMSVNVLVPM